MTIDQLSEFPRNRRTTSAALLLVALLASVLALQLGAGAATGRSASASVPATTTTTTVHWLSLESPTARGHAVGRSVVADLVRAGVPSPAVEVTDTGAAHGRFVQTTWTLQLSAEALSAVVHQFSSEFEVLVETAHHEARHAEQWFRIAQLRSSQGATSAQLATELSVPGPVAAAAAERPLATGSPQALAAQAWHDSIYGAGAARRNAIVDDVLDKKRAYNAAAGAHAASPDAPTTAALQEAKLHFDEAYELYRSLPEEADAFATAELRVNAAS